MVPRVFVISLFLALLQPSDQPGTLQRYSFDKKPSSRLKLGSTLREISGITFSRDAHLFAHDDESGIIYQLDTLSGKTIKTFSIGDWLLEKDFEDIELVGDTFYLLSSKGRLYAFREGGNGKKVAFTRYKTGLSSKNNVEGLCYDPSTDALLLACKDHPGKHFGHTRAVYSFSVRDKRLDPVPRFLIDLDSLKARFQLEDFRPSGISRQPETGNFFLISSVGNSILEISPDGALLRCAHLRKKFNPQPEGIGFTTNGTLYLASEGVTRGSIAIYRPRESTKKPDHDVPR